MSSLVRISMTIEPDLLARFDTYVESSDHFSRSEALRELIRTHLKVNGHTPGERRPEAK
ncbi:MAG: ribbon-helix-helix protein, CopG family [Alphaproteobacteria bacterium]|nr:ribbon-helix-helix protein, CopG family [Alphaproteobacteria bacterium]